MSDRSRATDSSMQMGLDLGMPTPPPIASVKKAPPTKKSKAMPMTVNVVASNAEGQDYEAMANALSAHADYRVIRRLKPQLKFPAATGPVKRVAVLDTETTGLSAASDCIIELAMVVVDIDITTGMPVGEVTVFDGFEDPGRPIPAEVQTLTGITDDMVRGHKLDLLEVNRVMNGVEWVVAHNAGFDRPFVEQRLPFFADLPWACSFADIHWKQLGQGSAKLETLAAAFGFFYDAHRADMDCHALLALLSQPIGDPAQTGWQYLLEALQRPQYLLQATGAPFDAKDYLKARGYRWDSGARVWHTRLGSEETLREECAWLAERVYANPRAQVTIVELDALARYAGRDGQVTMRAVSA